MAQSGRANRARELVALEDVSETLEELSHLADALLSRALKLAAASLERKLGIAALEGCG